MLQALLNNKLKDSFKDPYFRPSEDTLTSSVIGLMQYLPNEVIWKLLSQACGMKSNLTLNLGNIISFHFWARWNALGTSNSNFVEPDVWIETDKYDIIIEAKKHNSSVSQNKDQWKKELKALCNERLEDTNKKILFIALGGNESLYNDTVEVDGQSYTIYTASWYNLLHATINYREECQDSRIIRVMNDLISAFTIHRIYHVNWLKTLHRKQMRNSTIQIIKSNLEFDNYMILGGLYRPLRTLKDNKIKLWKILKS